LSGFVDRWHSALPFDEQERVGVYGLYRESAKSELAGIVDAPTVAELLGTTELEFMSGGVRKAVHGRELLQRWWEWRRSAGEFEGQDSNGEATKALGLMVAGFLHRDIEEVARPRTQQLISKARCNPA